MGVMKVTRFVHVRFTYNYNFPLNYALNTQEKLLFLNNYYTIQENKGYYVIVGVLWNVDNPVCIIPKTRKLALHQLKTVANYFILAEYIENEFKAYLIELQWQLEDEIRNYNPEWQEPEDTEIPWIVEEMHKTYQELQRLQKLVEQAENRIQIIREKTMVDDEEYTEYIVIV